jgi:Cellulase (glycosyl hydrolase family 5)
VGGSRSLVVVPGGGQTSVPGYYGALSIQGNQWVNGSGSPVLLKGVNNSGMEMTGFQGAHPWRVGGGGAVPNWSLLSSWAASMAGTSSALITRIPQNSASFLNLPVYTPTNSTTWGSLLTSAGSGTADPFGDYKSALVTAIQDAREVNCYIILDNHWGAIQLTLGGTTHYGGYAGQLGFMDVAVGQTYWTDSTLSLPVWLATNFGSPSFNALHGYNGGAAGTYYDSAYGGPTGFGDIVFELFNEPFLGAGTYTAGSADLCLLNGGTGTTYITNSGNITTTVNWTGYQACINGIRALGGINNAIIFNGNGYSSQLEHISTWQPTDSANQIAAGWHPYSQGVYPYTSSPFQYPGIGSDSGAGTSSAVQWAQAVLNSGIPVCITEDGNAPNDNAGTNYTQYEPHMSYMINWASARGVMYVPWTFGDNDYLEAYNTAATQNVILRLNSGGTASIPIAGEGWVVYLYIANQSDPNFTNSTTLPGGTAGGSYSVTFAGTLGAGLPYTFAWVSDSGAGSSSGSLNTSTGVLAFTLTATPGTYTIDITVFDKYLIATTVAFSLTVSAASSNFYVYDGLNSSTTAPSTGGALNTVWSQDLSYGTITIKYNDTTVPQSGQTYDALFTVSGTAGGWQPAANTHAEDIHLYTWMTIDWRPTSSASSPQMQWHYAQGSNDFYTCAALNGFTEWGNAAPTQNAWNPNQKVPLAAFGQLGQHSAYKFFVVENGPGSTGFAVDRVGFIPGNYIWLYNGGAYNGSGNDASTPLQGFSDASVNATSSYSTLPTVANAGLVSSLTGMVTPSSSSSPPTNCIEVSTTALNGAWKILNSSGLNISSYTYFTFGAYPSKASPLYSVQFYDTTGAALGPLVACASYFGNTALSSPITSTPLWPVCCVPLSVFTGLGSTIGGVAIIDETSNTTNVFYLSGIGFFS